MGRGRNGILRAVYHDSAQSERIDELLAQAKQAAFAPPPTKKKHKAHSNLSGQAHALDPTSLQKLETCPWGKDYLTLIPQLGGHVIAIFWPDKTILHTIAIELAAERKDIICFKICPVITNKNGEKKPFFCETFSFYAAPPNKVAFRKGHNEGSAAKLWHQIECLSQGKQPQASAPLVRVIKKAEPSPQGSS